MYKAYTDVCGINWLYDVCPPVCKIIHSLKLVDYLQIKAEMITYMNDKRRLFQQP